ncbi:MAG: thioredoxin-disulfide reductase [Ruminococcaceae bacterium]|jgi:thioredoxin reductase (NADPH)|nr:thioredoxin-disulfide reductase [Oscillospiraceae bacterium]
MYDIIIIGAGTAGLSAAIYGVRAGKKVLVLESASYGGQIVTSPEVENYPGIKKISGFEFATNLYEQAMELGAEIEIARVMQIRKDGVQKIVVTEEKEYACRAVILASGAKNRPLGLAKEQELIGKGISYCATCDGAFYKGKPVAVNGGGNTALEDAAFLTGYCEKVYLIHRRDSFRGEHKQVEALRQKANLEFVLDTNIVKLIADERLKAIEVQNTKTKETRVIEVSGLFVAIGQMPENSAFSPPVQLDQAGYIIAGEDCKTNVDGIFAAGDCRTKTVRQLATAAADGAVAALAACEYIRD